MFDSSALPQPIFGSLNLNTIKSKEKQLATPYSTPRADLQAGGGSSLRPAAHSVSTRVSSRTKNNLAI